MCGFIGGRAWFYLGGMHSFIWGGVCGFIWGHAWFYLGGVHGFIWGACVVLFRGGVHGFFSFFRYNEIRSMSRQYASYWNAFLLFIPLHEVFTVFLTFKILDPKDPKIDYISHFICESKNFKIVSSLKGKRLENEARQFNTLNPHVMIACFPKITNTFRK